MFEFLKNKILKNNGVYVLFDIGGTNIRLATSRDGKTIGDIRVVATPRNFDEGMETIKRLADEACKGAPVKAVCGGLPGVLNRDRATIFKLPNLPNWNQKPVKAELEDIFGAPIFLENDSALVGLGEATVGAGKGYHIVCYMTVSTGVGGARIVGGKIDEKAYDFEPGHETIDSSGLDFEAHVSGTAVAKKFGKYPRDINDPAILNDLASQLAVGLHNVILLWSPDAVVLGGSMVTGLNPIPLDSVELKLRELLTMFPEIPAIRKASLGDYGGLYGALKFVLQQKL